MSEIVLELSVILLLIGLNGIFAMSEIAIVSARQVTLKQRAEAGQFGYQKALELSSDPNRFLSTVQIGITLIGVFAGAFSGVTVAQKLADVLRDLPYVDRSATAISLALVVMAITFLSVVVGELVPKRIALHRPERMSALIARPMYWLSRAAGPVVSLLSITTEVILTILRIPVSQTQSVTEEEIRGLAEQGSLAGVIEEAEYDMVERVFALDDIAMNALMTPRPEIVWLDIRASESDIRTIIDESRHSLFPVCDQDLDHVLGIVSAKDLLSDCMAERPSDIASVMEKPLFLPENMRVLTALGRFKQTGYHMALLIDEYGNVEGLVTLIDILEALVGDIPTPDEIVEPPIVEREDGSYLVNGLIAIDEFKKAFDIRALPGEDDFLTLGGFVISILGRLPLVGDYFGWGGLRFEVIDMDGRRVDKVLVETVPEAEPPAELDE
jgi:putative hemolysin